MRNKLWPLPFLVLGCPPANPQPDAGTDTAAILDALDAHAPADASFDAPRPPTEMPIFVAPEGRAALEPYVEMLPISLAAEAIIDADPVAAMGRSTLGTRRIALVIEPSRCDGCFRLERTPAGFVVRGDAPLGIQYGLSALLEGMGIRFLHPQHTFVPVALLDPAASIFEREEEPEVQERGLHLHILHPIESYFDFWEPTPENLEDAERTMDWMVKNRANYLTYTGIDDIRSGPSARREALLAHQQAIVTRGHARGLRMGLGIQIFGESSLQNAFDLVERGEVAEESIPRHLDAIRSIPYDEINLSFGEFFSAEPARFVATIDLTYDEIQTRWPGATVTGTVHVGDFPDTRITYMGEEQLYYFLVRYSARPIRPWVHTVMYYDLFNDAGGAYNHERFDDHRTFLLDRLRAGQDVGYHPETAYWVAFDINIPTYLPVYMRTRFQDLDGVRDALAGTGRELRDHTVFSSGWEWGYWQNDWSVLRMSWHLPETYEEVVHDMLDVLPAGEARAEIVTDLADIQHTRLIEGRLAAYLAGQDGTFQLGFDMGFWSQPRRPSMAELRAMTPAERAAFERDVVIPLGELEAEMRAIQTRAMALVGDDLFLDELRDGIAIDVERASFAHTLWGAALAGANGEDIAARLTLIDASIARARVIVDRRHAELLDRDGATLISRRVSIPLLYRYGYLREAQFLCFWNRERAELGNAFHGESGIVPLCVL